MTAPLSLNPRGPLYERIGADALARLVDRFYARVAAHPELAPLFPADLALTAEKQLAFLTGFLGGPPLYHERFGNPRLRAQHLPFPITPARAQALAAGWQGGGEVRAAGPGEVPWGQVGLVINSSSAGLDRPDETPLPGFDFGQLPAHAGVYDMVYKPRRTRLMRDAEAAGLPAENGLGMLAQQARLAFTAWTGVDVPVSVFLAALEAAATGRGAGDAARTEATR